MFDTCDGVGHHLHHFADHRRFRVIHNSCSSPSDSGIPQVSYPVATPRRKDRQPQSGIPGDGIEFRCPTCDRKPVRLLIWFGHILGTGRCRERRLVLFRSVVGLLFSYPNVPHRRFRTSFDSIRKPTFKRTQNPIYANRNHSPASARKIRSVSHDRKIRTDARYSKFKTMIPFGDDHPHSNVRRMFGP